MAQLGSFSTRSKRYVNWLKTVDRHAIRCDRTAKFTKIVQFLPNLAYPENEIPKLSLLKEIFIDWHQHFSDNGSLLKKHVADDMVADGFYPHYFSQKKRVLFIGRESRDIAGHHYIDVLHRAYCEEKRIGSSQSLNRSKFHYRMIYIAYGIMNDMPAWENIPFASEIVERFAVANGLSFAFMNISKLSNDETHWELDQPVYDLAHKLSTQGARNFIQEEIALLEPDIVIAMNLKGKVDSLGKLTALQDSHPRSFWLDSNGHRSLLIDTWHFSAPGKHDIKDYYTPICDAIRHSESFCRQR